MLLTCVVKSLASIGTTKRDDMRFDAYLGGE